MYIWHLSITQNGLLNLSILHNLYSYRQKALQVYERAVLTVALSTFRRIASNTARMLLSQTLQLTLYEKRLISFNDQ
jgi:hypothetical protein